MTTDPVDRILDAIVDRVLERLADRIEQTHPTLHHEPHG